MAEVSIRDGVAKLIGLELGNDLISLTNYDIRTRRHCEVTM